MPTQTYTSAAQNPARGPIRGLRETNRRAMKAPRPAVTPAIAYRIRQWFAEIERARDEKQIEKRISLGCDRYLKRIKGLPTVQAGGFADIRDKVMAGWLGRSPRQVMRYRAEAVAAGLLEDLGTAGLDHRPCMVRPLLSDGPVFTDSSGTLDTTRLSHQRASLSDSPKKTSPPSPSRHEQETCGPALVAPEVVSESAPATPPEGRERRPADEGIEARPEPITFAEFWAASDKVGSITAAEAIWRKTITHADKAAIAAALKRDGRLKTGSSYVGNWLKFKNWPPLDVPTTAKAVQVFVHANTPEWKAWQAHLIATRGKGTPTDKAGGWMFPSQWPPA